MKLWLVRHAQPLVEAGVCYGRLDVPADSAATKNTALALAAALPQQMAVYTSPLQRCEWLAHALYALRPDLALKMDARLAEMDFGTWEGQAWDSIGAQALDAWTQDFAHHQPGGGESVHGFMQRVAAVWDANRAIGEDAVWITHAGVVRAAHLLRSGQRQLTDAHQWPQHAVPLGQWEILEI